MMFGTIKQNIHNILFENYSNKEKFKSLFNEFYLILKKNKSLKEYYVTYSNLEDSKFNSVEDATHFLNESIDYLKSLDVDFTVINNFILKHRSSKDFVKETLFENIDILLTNTKSTLIENKINAKKYVISHLTNVVEEKNDIIEGVLPIKVYTNLMVKKFNKKYNDLTENEKKIVKTFVSNDSEKLKDIENNLIKENLEIANSKLDIIDDEIKSKIEKVKLKLENYTSINTKDSILKLIKLKTDLESLYH